MTHEEFNKRVSTMTYEEYNKHCENVVRKAIELLKNEKFINSIKKIKEALQD